MDDFESTEKLAGYLNYLMANETEYNQYFDWYENFNSDRNLILVDKLSQQSEGLCKLCESLHMIRNGSGYQYPVINNLEKWWNGDENDRICF